MRLGFSRFAFAGLALVSVASGAIGPAFADSATSRDQQPPNVLLIVTDDQGYGDLSAHGNPFVKTPNLDQLRAQSVRLEDYHVDPVCTPTRAAFLTGRYCGRVGAWAVTHGRQLLHPREVTIADAFRESGYRTGMFGKWHLGDPPPFDPNSRGFEEVVCCRAGGVDEIGNPMGNDYSDDIYYRNGSPERFSGYCTDVFTNEAIRFVSDGAARIESKPFLVYLATNAMHSPFIVPDRYADPFRAQGLPEKRARFYGMIENFDENLGRLLAALDRSGQSENTIVVFFGDNGTAANSAAAGAYNAGMRGDKGTVYEGGHRVACFVRWPAGLPSPGSVEQLTSHRDWMPTLLDLCGLDAPSGVRLDGQSITPLLRSQDASWLERTFFVERQAVTPVDATREGDASVDRTGAFPQYAVLTERWRLVNGELYDIVSDPAQKQDVAEDHPQVVADLQRRYRDYFADVYSEVDEDTRFVVGAPGASSTEFTVRDWRPTSGGVIWEPSQLGDDRLTIQGYWPIEVVRDGRFRVEFARFPFEANQPIGARHAELRIDDRVESLAVEPTASVVAFETELKSGRHRLEGVFEQSRSRLRRGPYFVRVTYLANP